MNDAHLHLVVNHFPIIGAILGLGILLFGLILNSKTTQNVAYVLFVVSAIFAFISDQTGGGAAHMLKENASIKIARNAIKLHAQSADTFALAAYTMGVASLVGLFLNIKNNSRAKLVSFLVLIIAAVAVYFGTIVGTTGGEIRHTEIRNC
jgi:uncharacterized membrane protein